MMQDGDSRVNQSTGNEGDQVRWRATPEGLLHTLRERLEEAHRELARSEVADKARVEAELAELQQKIDEQQRRSLMDELQKLDTLAIADPAGTLKPVHAAVDQPRSGHPRPQG